jgi:DNA recombination protein RmuC
MFVAGAIAFMDMATSPSLWQTLAPWGFGALLGATITALTMGWAYNKNRAAQQALLKAEFEQALQSQAFATQRAQEQLKVAEEALTEARQTNLALQGSQAELQTEVAVLKNELETQKSLAKSAEAQWEKNFHAFLTDTLQQAKTQFKQQVSEEHHEKAQALDQKMQLMVQPIQEMIQKYQVEIESVKKLIVGADISFREQVQLLNQQQKDLTAVLKTNKGAGSWGELLLEGILENSGLIKGTHFETQTHDVQGRPDFKVNLPHRGYIYIDVKTLQLTADELVMFEKPELHEEYRTKLVASMTKAVRDLARRDYTKGKDDSPNFVVLFVPKESMISHAWDGNHQLWEEALRHNIILSGPLNIIALLKTVRYSWEKHQLSTNALEIESLGKALHEQLVVFLTKMLAFDKQFRTAANGYEEAMISLTGPRGVVRKTNKLAYYGAKSGKPLPKESLRLSEVEQFPSIEFDTESRLTAELEKSSSPQSLDATLTSTV